MNYGSVLDTYQGLLPASWGLDALSSMLLCTAILVLTMTTLSVGLAALRGQRGLVNIVLADCCIGVACIASIFGAGLAAYFFLRAFVKAATY